MKSLLQLCCRLRALLRLKPVHKDRRLRRTEFIHTVNDRTQLTWLSSAQLEALTQGDLKICSRCLRIRGTRKRVKA